jgi:hypothetical protein
LALGDDSLHSRFGNVFEVLNLYPGILLVQIGLHALIDDRIARPSDGHRAFLLCGIVKLSDRWVVGFALS